MQLRHNKFVYLIIALALGIAGCKPFEKKPKVEKGIFDLTGWDFNKKGTIQPDGQWEFYWNHLYTPGDFQNGTTVVPGYITVPENWNNIPVDGGYMPGRGYGTYRLHVKGMPEGIMGIRMPDEYAAYKLWINGELVATNGTVGTGAETERAELRPLIKAFSSKAENDFVVQVSNFYLYKGGMGTTPVLGTADQIIHNWNAAEAINIFIIGMLMILFLYHLLIFITTKNDYNSLWFALLCFFIGARCLATNERLVNAIFPDMPISLLVRIEYEGVFGAITLLGLFIRGLFPKEFSKIILWIFVAYVPIQLLLIFVTPVHFFTSWLTVFQVGCLVQLIYVSAVITKAIFKKRPLSGGMLLVSLLIIATGVNDILYARLVIHTTFALSYSIPALLIIQAYFIASRIGHALNNVEKLSGELNIANQNLEQKVIDRTAELSDEKQKTDELLLNILPAETADELKEKGFAVPRTYSMVSVMFAKLTGLPQFKTDQEAIATVDEIGVCFSAFDAIIEAHGLEKIKTIGDVYLCASGLPVPTLHHAENSINAATEMRDFMNKRKTGKENNSEIVFDIKIGIHIGPVVAGIVGSKKFAYDIWGDTVNTSARLQQHSEPGMINVSGNMHDLLKNKYNYAYRGKIDAKNKGMIDMYYIE